LSNGRDWDILIVYNLETNIKKRNLPDLISLQATQETAFCFYQALLALGYSTELLSVDGTLDQLKKRLSELNPKKTFIFNLCDGYKEEKSAQACITQLIDSFSFLHSGSSAETIAICTDKSIAKQRLIDFGLPTPDFQVFDHPGGEVVINFPVIVKPLYEDGSVGIFLESVSSNNEEVQKNVKYIIDFLDQPALVEEFIPGREVSVSLWGNEDVQLLPIIEHDYSLIENALEHILTYETKWIPDYYYDQNIVMHCPAELQKKMNMILNELAKSAFHAVGLRDFGRIDFRMNGKIPYILDINEIPDMHPEAGFALSANAAGFNYESMIERILEISLLRQSRK